MKALHRLASLFLIPAMLCGITLGISAASPLRFSEGFETLSEGKTYPASKCWGSTAQFTVMAEEDHQFLRMPMIDTNKDAAIIPFSGTVRTATHGYISIQMDLRPVHRDGNGESFYDFRVREYTYTDADGNELAGKWKNLFRMHVNAEGAYLSDFSGVPAARIPLVAKDWNHVIVTLDLREGRFTVISGDYNASCSLGFQNLSFNATQLQFCQMPKSCTAYVASEAKASYVDVDGIKLEQYVPEDLSRYDGLLRSVGASAIRLDQGSDAEGATLAGIRYVSEVRRDLLTELKLMKLSGKLIDLEIGTLIAPTDDLMGTELTRELSPHSYLDLRSDNGYYTVASEESATLAGSIVGIKEKNLGRSFTARAYVSALFATGQIFTVYGDAMTATAKSLACDALEAHASGSSDYSEKLSLLESYAAAPDFAVKDPFRIMSYNVYYTDVNSERADSVLDMIEKHSPDVAGLQEVTLEVWKPLLMDRLGDRYAYVGHGRENGGIGEGTPIIYRKDKFTLLDSGTRWLSDTPTVWSKYEGSRQSRIFTYAVLKRNSDGQVFSFLNTHLDTVSESVRVRQLGSLARQIPELGLNEHPMILTGDMNAFASAGGEIPLILGLGFKDTMHLTVQPTTSTTSEVIDFCFVRADCTVLSHQRDGEKSYNDSSPSDHLPIVADIRLH